MNDNIVDLKQRVKDKQQESEKPKPVEPVDTDWHIVLKQDDGTIVHKAIRGVVANLMPMLIIINAGAPADPNSAVFMLPVDKLQYIEKIEVPQAQEG